MERAELFGDHEGVVVRQHDPARADPDRAGRVADVRQHHRGRTPGDAFHRVMLGDPEAFVSRRFGNLRELCRIGQRLAHTAAFADWDQIEDRKWDHRPSGPTVGAGPSFLERLARPGTLWLDKTGTLTFGRMSVIDWHGDDEAIPYAAALEQSIHHPIAKAICEFAIPEQGQLPLATKIDHRRGKGAKGLVEGVPVVVGNEAWLKEQGSTFSADWLELQSTVLSQNHPLVWVAINGTVRGMFEMGDPLRDDAVETLRFLSAKGWELGILSGDRQEIVDSVAAFLRSHGIALNLALGQQSPEDKLERIRRSKAESGRPCVMVGDGVNDAAALAMADVGIAIRGGSEQALYAAPIFIGNGRLASVAELITASTRVVRGIRRCFVASLIYNAVTMTLAIMGLIHPLMAAVLMPISGLTVLAMAKSTQAFTGTRSR